jgi:hypothetical protein
MSKKAQANDGSTGEWALIIPREMWDRTGAMEIATVDLAFNLIERKQGEYEIKGSHSWDLFNDMSLHCQVSWSYTNGFQSYAWGARYRGWQSIELRDAERMLRTLKMVAKAEEKFPIRPANFSQYVVMVCRGLKIQKALVFHSPEVEKRTGVKFRVQDVKEAGDELARRFAEFKESVLPEAA